MSNKVIIIMNTLLTEVKDNYMIVQMNRGRSNPINAEMVAEIRTLLKKVENDPNIQGVILTGQRNFFSVGLDVIELYHYNETEMANFWDGFIDMIGDLARFPKPLISAITGHSPAGGCILAICSDYRIMAEQSRFKIGLNEVPVGIVIPSGILALYAFWMGEGKAYQAMMEGYLFEPVEALAANLVDEILDQDEVLAAAEKKMKHYLSFQSSVWMTTKKSLRAKLIREAVVSQEDRALTLRQWWSAESREILKKMVGRLSPIKKA
ncbi:MAG: 3,2-trans-enoyl-CoA isomerase [Maribacter sp.]